MKNILFKTMLILVFFLAISCDIQKTAQKSKTDTSLKDNFEKRSFRQGDSVSYRPNRMPGIVYKDTTIYRITKNNTRLETVYDSNGNIRDINCYTDKIEELTRRNLELEQSKKEKESSKTEKFDSSFILYFMGGVVLIMFFALFLFFLYIKQNTATLTAAITKISS
jgi:ATP-dependent Zn protease